MQQFHRQAPLSKTNGGFTLIELLIVIAILGILGAVLLGALFHTPADQQKQATENLNGWLDANGIKYEQIKRANCAHDSDGDGWATCTVVTKPSGEEQGEHISLQCVTGWLKDKMGASGCKEVDGNFKTTRGRPQ